uniref:Uncharacterized protein n=1 Tax=Globodera rostochiensis TaxID=31243 RepID=A0A914HKM0_GLORO
MKSDRSSTQQEQMRKRRKRHQQQQYIDHSIRKKGEKITQKKLLGPSSCSLASTLTVPVANRHIELHNCSRRSVQTVGLTPKHERGAEPSSWIKRKFYIVENNGEPTEVYCTDLIHRARQRLGSSTTTKDGSHRLLRVVDKWREEWNHGVQMPLGTSKEDSIPSEHTALFPDLAEPECFQLPSKLILLDRPSDNNNNTNSRYANTTHFQFVTRPPNLYYALDNEDTVWLKKKRSSTQLIPARTFVDVMNCFELLVYKKMHDDLLESFKSALNSSEDDAECCICRWPVWETGDQIVFCDGCNIAVHQVCYGIAAVPHDQWFCKLCTHFGRPSTAQECLFCPVRGGAMKATKHLESWAHVVCALFLAEVRFGDAEQREPITHVNEVPAEKWRARCCVCDTRSGACIKCTHSKCEETFHVSCAQCANFVLDIENDERELNGVKYVSLCGKHSSRTQQYRNRQNFRFNKNRLSEMNRHFEQYVDVSVVAEHLNTPPEIVGRIYGYWVCKRNQNNKRPLIAEPEDCRSICIGPTFPSVSNLTEEEQQQQESVGRRNDDGTDGRKRRKRAMAKQRPQQQQSVPAEYEQMPRRRLNDQYEKIRQLRLQFEKARNLCYMVARREKLKQQCLDQFEQQVKRTATSVFGRVPPVSSRCMERLLSEWREAVDFRVEDDGTIRWRN